MDRLLFHFENARRAGTGLARSVMIDNVAMRLEKTVPIGPSNGSSNFCAITFISQPSWVENTICLFITGRKGWLFSGSPKGTRTSAILHALIETAMHNQWNPQV